MDLRPCGSCTDASEGQPSKAAPPTASSPAGSPARASEAQPANARAPMVLTVAGSSTRWMFAQPSKAPSASALTARVAPETPAEAGTETASGASAGSPAQNASRAPPPGSTR